MTKSRRALRPQFDSLEEHCLMSAGLTGLHVSVQASNHIHVRTTNLRLTPVGTDVKNALASVIPTTGLISTGVRTLTVNTLGTVHGIGTATYRVPNMGLVRVTLNFSTNVDNPQPGDIRLSDNRHNSLVTPQLQTAVANSVVSFIKADAKAIKSFER